MNFAEIERNNVDPPDDWTIVTAMAAAGGRVTSIEHVTKPTQLRRAYYSGDPNRETFVRGLGGNAKSWDIYWGSALAAENPITAGTAAAGTVGTQYSLVVHNNSQLPNSRAIVFQRDPNLAPGVVSLAWMSQWCPPNTSLIFRWTLDFNFVWGATGNLKSGVNYMAGQVIPADLTDHNTVTLSCPHGGFLFGPTSAGPWQGSLFVRMSDDVPGYGNPNQGCVGIGMYGSGTFVMPTTPTGAGGFEFVVRPQYWVAFGNSVVGDVVDESMLLVPTQVTYPAGSFQADCSFDGTRWTITYS